MSSFVVKLTSAIAVALIAAGCDSSDERVEDYYQRGLELVEQGEVLKGSLEFRNALKLDNDHAPALFALAQAEQEMGELLKAASIYMRVIEAAPEHVEARVRLGNILVLAGQLDEAWKYASQAHGLAGDNPEVLVLMAAVTLRLENGEDAVRYAHRALEVSPDNADALMILAAERLNAGDARGALALLERGEEKHDSNVGVQLFRLRALTALEDTEGIEAALQKLVRFHPENEAFRYSLASWYVGAGRVDDAEAVIRNFVDENHENEEAGLNFVKFLIEQRDAEAARAELVRRIEAGSDVLSYQLALAKLDYGAGDTDAAYALLNKLISEEGETQNGARAAVLLARMKAEQNAFDEAEALVDTVLAYDAHNAEALAIRAGVRIADKSYDKAIADLLVALNEEPDSASLLRLLAVAYELDGAVELAEEQFSKAVNAAGFAPEFGLEFAEFLMRYGKTGQAERLLMDVRRVAPADIEVLTRLARLKLDRQDWVGAQEIAEALRQAEAGKATADQILAEVMSGQQRHEQSIELLRSAAASQANEDSALSGLVRAYVLADRADAAQEFLASVLEANPENVSARVLVGFLHEYRGDLEAAEETYRLAAEHDSDSVAGHDALARFYVRQNRNEEAEVAVRAALELQKTDLGLRFLLATIHEHAGRIDAAIAEYERMFEEAPQSAIIANNLASLLSEYAKDEATIERAYAIAVRFRTSEIPQFMDTLGWIYYQKGEYEQAIALLRPAAEQLQDLALAHYHAGMAYRALGQAELASESLQRALTLAKGQRFAQLDEARTALEQIAAPGAGAQ